jgi:hypothetical protein
MQLPSESFTGGVGELFFQSWDCGGSQRAPSEISQVSWTRGAFAAKDKDATALAEIENEVSLI